MMGNYHVRCGVGEKPEMETSEAYLSLLSLPDDFDKILSVMRSRGVSVSIILQNLAQLKALFEKQWESIVGNCDEFVYLGGNEKETHKYVSELLGKETIDTNTYGKSSGRNGNYSTNYQGQQVRASFHQGRKTGHGLQVRHSEASISQNDGGWES